jgi:palmitoyltransferase ZDHHC1/11
MTTVTIPVRVNGLQYPPSRDQIKTLIIYPATVFSSFLITRVTLSDDIRLMVLLMTLNGALSVLIILAWISVSYIDPELKEGSSGIPVVCYSSPDKSARFCGACRKTVPGLDHHCTWLNTCIGRRNYVPFICLVFIGAAQSALNAVIGFITAAVWITNGRTSERSVCHLLSSLITISHL